MSRLQNAGKRVDRDAHFNENIYSNRQLFAWRTNFKSILILWYNVALAACWQTEHIYRTHMKTWKQLWTIQSLSSGNSKWLSYHGVDQGHVHSWTKVYRFFFNELLHRDNGGNQPFVNSGMETHHTATNLWNTIGVDAIATVQCT